MAVKIEKPENVNRIAAQDDPQVLQKNLNLLCEKAHDAGAVDAAVINSGQVIFSSAVIEHVMSDDRCPSIHWPLNYPKDDIQGAILTSTYGIFFRAPTIPDMPDYGGGPIDDIGHRNSYVRLYDMVSLIESACFYMGYHLALGFAAGNCRSVFCSSEKRCWPMLKGRPCIRPNRGRPSMEAAGMDSLSMAKSVNWSFSENEKAPLLTGLVMVT